MARTKQAGPVTQFVMGVIFIVVGGAVAFFLGLPTLRNANASADWPSTTGVIKRSEVVKSRNSDGDTMYKPVVEYAYQVDGKDFECNKIWFGGGSSSSNSSGAYETVGQFPKGAEVPVYYHPEKPFEAVLQPGAFFSSYLVLIVGVVFALVGLLLLGAVLVKLFVIGAAVGYAVTRKG